MSVKQVSDENKATAGWFPLVAHKIAVRTFDLSTGLNYVSIKDQIVRACALIDSLAEARILRPQAGTPSYEYDLIVVGAGAAGVSAAWRADCYGANTLLVESGAEMFSVQRRCTHRHVSMSMYDWPEIFATSGAFPSLGGLPVVSSTPEKLAESGFPCVAAPGPPKRAADLVKEWDAQLQKFPLKCERRFNTHATPVPPGKHGVLSDSSGYVMVTLSTAGSESQVFSSNVVFATGIGVERKLNGGYASPPFWSDDERAPWLPGASLPGETVVVSGAGDGAIQDVIKSLLVIHDGDLIPVAESLFLKKEMTAVKSRILAIERHAERQLLWGVHENDVFRAMQRSYCAIVNEIQPSRIQKWKKQYLRPVGPSVKWVMIEPKVFTKTYPLNRLLASVLSREEFTPRMTFVQGKLADISKNPMSEFWTCFLEDGATLTSDYPPMLRHGIEVNVENGHDDEDLKTLRAAISRAPVPFKPFDF
ncbi:FAD-dependent oxidoreductase [Paraburkholderia bryophila]|uniref:FAD/NAD(P)-binding domain-containing protein n=1 Tax=Paraburkholderia bryophila TaxID=420952 RepID=A0A7Y9WN77_9BURK|nr:FAD-dependent oxidoreductase [Paraburkholderia bryophila]NYH22883.1 hypothetical protein [Paraburkholderia bryophila]